MPTVTKNNDLDDVSKLQFTLSDVDVSYANGIRRTIISDISILVFRTSPHERNKCEIIANTSRLNNEMIKQRLSCIPICANDIKEYQSFVDNYILEIDVENITDEVITVTSKDFKIKNTSTGEYLSENLLNKIFPPYIDTFGGNEHYIPLVRLRPRISEKIPGEKIVLNCKFDIGTAKEDSSFNVAGTCTYRRTPDVNAISRQLQIEEGKFRNQGLNDDEIEFEKKNWRALDGMRYVIPNSFDFTIESVGIFSNEKLVLLACSVISAQLDDIIDKLTQNTIDIQHSNNTKPNCYEIYFQNYDYTIGNIINHQMYEQFFTTDKIHSVSTKKIHPHDDYITMEVSVVSDSNPRDNLTNMLIQSCQTAKDTIKSIRKSFKRISGTRDSELVSGLV